MTVRFPVITRMGNKLRPRNEEDRNAWFLTTSAFFMGLAMGGIVAFMPVFLARLGASTEILGIYNSVPGLLMGALLIPGSIFSERYANQVAVRCKVQAVKRVVQLICGILPFFFSSEPLIYALVVVWTLATLLDAFGTPAFTTVISRAVSPARRPRVNSVRWAVMAGAMAISSALCGWILDRIVFPTNYQVVFLGTVLLSLLDPLIYSRVRIEPFATLSRTSTMLKGGWGEFFKPIMQHKPFMRFVLRTAPFRLSLNIAVPLYSLFWVNELAATDTLIGFRGTVANFALVLGYLMWGRLAHRLGHRSLAVFGGAGAALYPLLTALVPSAVWIVPVALVWGLSVGGIDVGLFDMMLGYSTREMQPRFGAVWNMIGQLMIFLGPVVGVALADWVGIRGALTAAGIIQLASLALVIGLPRDC